MSYAQIDMVFTKFSDVPSTEYMLNTVVNQATSFPTPVAAPLVIQKGDDTTDEELVRIAERSEIVTIPFTPLPTSIRIFSSLSLPLAQIGDPSDPLVPLAPTAILAGDIIRVTTPDLWQEFFGVISTVEYEVATIVSPTEVTITTDFPAFARNLPFEVLRDGTTILPVGDPLVYPTDGLANRDYTGLSETYYLASSHVDSWTDLTVAENRVTNLKSQAKLLINEMNTADWTGTERAEYP